MQIEQLLAENYGLQVTDTKRLDGYANENYRVQTLGGQFVLKLYDPEPNLRELIDAENRVLELLREKHPDLFPVPQRTRDGKLQFDCRSNGKIVRLLSFLEGECIGRVKFTPELLYSFGRTLGKLNTALLGFRDIAIESKRSAWDLQNFQFNRKFLNLIKDRAERNLVDYFLLQAKEFAEPHFEDLRKCTIQGDANEWNVLARNGEVCGIIDFGDLFYSPLITEVAIAAAYATIYVEDPVEDILPLVRGYHEVLPLKEEEIGLLYYFIPSRLCISVCHSALAAREMPENVYARVSEKGAWESLAKWIKLNPSMVEARFRIAAGFDQD